MLGTRRLRGIGKKSEVMNYECLKMKATTRQKKGACLKILNAIKPVTCAVELLPLQVFELSGFLFSGKYQQIIEPGPIKW